MFFLDCEASSLNDHSFPIEIAWVAETGQGESYLIRPELRWTDWSAKAESIHRISYASLHRDGHPAAFVANRVVSVLAGQTLVSDNPTWDEQWMTVLLATIQHPALPVISLDRVLAEQMRRIMQANTGAPNTAEWHRQSRHLLDHAQSIIGSAQYEAIVSQSVRHRALADAERLWRTWRMTKETIDQALGK